MATLEDFEAKLADYSVTRIDGDPTMHTFDRMIEELRPIVTKIKTDLFPKGEDYGFLAIICTDEEYGHYIDNDEYMFVMPIKPDEYDFTIPDGIGETQRKMREALHNKKKLEFIKFTAVSNCIRKIIAAAVPEEYLEELKDPLLGYDKKQPYDMLQHLRKNIALTTADVDEMKNTVFIKWDPGHESLRAFINRMEKGARGCKRWNIGLLESDLVQHLVKQAYQASIFEMKIMSDWEGKRTVLKTWKRAKEYFVAEADKQKNHSKATAKQAGYHSAANVEEMNEVDDNVNAVVEAMTKTAEEMNMVAAANAGYEATIKEMAGQISKLIEMNTNLVKLIEANGKEAPTQDKAPAGNNKSKSGGKKCKYCGKKHKGADKFCLARKCNAHLREGTNWSGTEVDE